MDSGSSCQHSCMYRPKQMQICCLQSRVVRGRPEATTVLLLRAQSKKLMMNPWSELMNTLQPLTLVKSFAVHKRTQSGLTGSEMAISGT